MLNNTNTKSAFFLISDFILNNPALSDHLRDYWESSLAKLNAGLPMDRAFQLDLSNGRRRRDQIIVTYADSLLGEHSDWQKAGIIAREIVKIKSTRGGSPMLKVAARHYKLPSSQMQVFRIIQQHFLK